MRFTSLAIAVTAFLSLSGCEPAQQVESLSGQASLSQIKANVAKSNADMAFANYSDSLETAQNLRQVLQTFVAQPTEANFEAAKQAWLAAREPYGQTEVFRFREGPIDTLRADGTYGVEGEGPEGRLNAWPLGEALIDYVATNIDGDAGPESPANALGQNLIANVQDFPEINKQVLLDYFEHGEDERNVTTGYHAIEFLLWGQDLNADGTASAIRDNTPGQRPLSDYFTTSKDGQSQCTSGSVSVAAEICQRRGAYLLAAADILIDDLQLIASAWDPKTGSHYQNFIAKPDVAISRILEGMGRLSFGELAGERINIAVSTDSQEDEHSCFSDNTHRDILLNAQGIENVYLASYKKVNGELFQGESIYQLLQAMGKGTEAEQLKQQLAATMQAAAAIDNKANNGEPFDVLIQQGVAQAEIRDMIASLVKQTEGIEQVIKSLALTTGELRQDTEQDI